MISGMFAGSALFPFYFRADVDIRRSAVIAFSGEPAKQVLTTWASVA